MSVRAPLSPTSALLSPKYDYHGQTSYDVIDFTETKPRRQASADSDFDRQMQELGYGQPAHDFTESFSNNILETPLTFETNSEPVDFLMQDFRSPEDTEMPGLVPGSDDFGSNRPPFYTPFRFNGEQGGNQFTPFGQAMEIDMDMDIDASEDENDVGGTGLNLMHPDVPMPFSMPAHQEAKVKMEEGFFSETKKVAREPKSEPASAKKRKNTPKRRNCVAGPLNPHCTATSVNKNTKSLCDSCTKMFVDTKPTKHKSKSHVYVPRQFALFCTGPVVIPYKARHRFKYFPLEFRPALPSAYSQIRGIMMIGDPNLRAQLQSYLISKGNMNCGDYDELFEAIRKVALPEEMQQELLPANGIPLHYERGSRAAFRPHIRIGQSEAKIATCRCPDCQKLPQAEVLVPHKSRTARRSKNKAS